MKPPEPWRALLDKAAQDEQAADRLGMFQDSSSEIVGFHLQQAAEKMLKAAYMALKGRIAPRIHNLPILLREAGGPEHLIEVSAELTADYATTRYPATADPAFERYDRSVSEDRLARAEEIVEWAERASHEADAGAT